MVVAPSTKRPGGGESNRSINVSVMPRSVLTAHAAATIAILAVVFTVYFESYRSLTSVWLSSDTFLHGLVIFPISLYLVWRKWPELRLVVPTPYFPGTFAILSLSLLWLVSDLLGIQVAGHLAIVAMVPAVVLTVMGLRFTQVIMFPLAYLIFAVPLGESLIPVLIDFTATFTAKALDITGIPVIRDGRYFSIPSGDFEVARACSGIRYLLAAFSLGTLYGYISFQSIRKRVIFALFSIVLPVIANGLRAYGIVLVAHYSDMKYAVGADHILFGWVFFGIVIMAMFLVGNHFHDAPPESGIEDGSESAGIYPQPEKLRGATLLVIPLALVFAAAGPFFGSLIGQSVHDDLSEFAKLPDEISSWRAGSPYDQRFRPKFSGASRKLYARYDNDNYQVNVAVIQYSGHQQNSELANFGNSVVDKSALWRLGNVRTLSLKSRSGETVNIQEVLAIRGRETGIVWYWFTVNGQTVTSALEIKLREAQNLLSGRRNISSAVVLAVDVKDDIAASRSALRKFADAAFAPISKCLESSDERPDCGHGKVVRREN